MIDPVRIFIGSSSNGEDAPIEVAYEYSLRQHCSRELDITWMRQSTNHSDPWGLWQAERWSTPFSGFRWGIPEVCGFEGRAIYTDCDMINLRDIAELVDIDMQGKPIAARRGSRFGGHEFCVMVFDCAEFRKHAVPIGRMRTDPGAHHRMISTFSGKTDLVTDIDPRWNCLDGEDRSLDDIWQLHYTKMETQPWQPGWFTGEPKTHARPDIAQVYYEWNAKANGNGYCEKDRIDLLSQNKFIYNIIGR